MTEPTVYVNDYAGSETEVYHGRKAHATKRNRWSDRYVRETTPRHAVWGGLRPCKVCDPPTPDRWADPPEGYPFPNDHIVYCSAYGDFDPDANSYIAIARLPEEHELTIGGKKHDNTHRLVIFSPIRGPVSFLINPQADGLGFLAAALNIIAEDAGNGGWGTASVYKPFIERKAGVEVSFTEDDSE